MSYRDEDYCKENGDNSSDYIFYIVSVFAIVALLVWMIIPSKRERKIELEKQYLECTASFSYSNRPTDEIKDICKAASVKESQNKCTMAYSSTTRPAQEIKDLCTVKSD